MNYVEFELEATIVLILEESQSESRYVVLFDTLL